MKFLLVVLFLLSSGSTFSNNNSQGRELISVLEKPIDNRKEYQFGTFVISTEFQQGKAKSIYESAPEGALITVGSERGFRAAAMMTSVSYVFLIDLAPEIIRFNRINRELLKATTLEKYKKLRWSADWNEWSRFLSSNKIQAVNQEDYIWWEDKVRNVAKMTYALPESLYRYGKDISLERFQSIRFKLHSLSLACSEAKKRNCEQKIIYAQNAEEWNSLSKQLHANLTFSEDEDLFWKNNVQNEKTNGMTKDWLKDPKTELDLGKIIDYKTGHYLFSELLYQKLHKLALQNKIICVQIDLKDKKSVETFIKVLNKNRVKISLFDFNNLYYKDYLGQESYTQMLNQFDAISSTNSLLVAMSNYKNFTSGQFQIYFAFEMDNFKKWDKHFDVSMMLNSIPEEAKELLNGKIYRDNDELPSIHSLESE